MRFLLLTALAGAVAWLAADPIRGLVVQWATSPDASYGAILAIVGIALLWQRRPALTPTPLTWPGFFLTFAVVVAGLAMYVAGQVSADLFTTRTSLVVLTGGLIGFIAGAPALRAAAIPLAFLLLAIPLPELVVTTLTGSLQTFAAGAAEVLLTHVGVPVYRDGNVLELPTFTLQVVEACSGLRSVVSLAAVGILLAWASDRGRWARATIVLATVPIAVAVNALRLAGTGVAVEYWSPDAARDPWHSVAGWLTFVISLSALWGVQRLLAFRRAPLRSPQWREAEV